MEVSGHLHDPGRFSPRERASGTHWIGGWVGSRAGLDAVVKRKIPSPYGKIIGWKNFDWMHLAQDGNQWRAGVKTAMNLRVP
jgi:hypothetical protein